MQKIRPTKLRRLTSTYLTKDEQIEKLMSNLEKSFIRASKIEGDYLASVAYHGQYVELRQWIDYARTFEYQDTLLDGILIVLNDIIGNINKHYECIELRPEQINDFIKKYISGEDADGNLCEIAADSRKPRGGFVQRFRNRFGRGERHYTQRRHAAQHHQYN